MRLLLKVKCNNKNMSKKRNKNTFTADALHSQLILQLQASKHVL